MEKKETKIIVKDMSIDSFDKAIDKLMELEPHPKSIEVIFHVYWEEEET